MKIETFVLGQLNTNCYIVHDNGEAIIIDPADESVFIAEKIQQLNLKPIAIVATHGHFDHVLAGGELQMILDIPFLINLADGFLLKRMNQTAEFWLKQKFNFPLPKKIENISDGDVLNFGRCNLKALETPGHTPGSVCFLTDNKSCRDLESPVLFSGDTLFKNGIGRFDFQYSNREQIFNSLNKIFKLSEETLIYPGHDDITSVGAEKK